MTAHVSADAVVVGGGTAGLNAALQLARRGLHVALLESRSLTKGGARWANGIVGWQFDRAGIDRPVAPELRARGGCNLMVSPDGSVRFPLDSPTLDVDMRRLGSRLRDAARDAGVRLFDRAGAPRARFEGGRLVSIEVETAPEDSPEPTAHRFDAPLFVDASGRAAVLRRQSSALDRWCPEVATRDLCSASQFTYRVTDRDAARRFLDDHDARPGDTIDWLGFAGGYSVLVMHLEESLDQVSVLTGTIASGTWGDGRSILQLAKARHPWIGEPVFGGSGIIPIRRPYDRFTAPGLALVGDSACQVFPAHGSGIGIGLIAGTLLAEAVERDGSIRADDDGDPGSEQTLWDYQATFQREHGGTLAAYDVLRRLTMRLGTDGVLRMFRSGVVSADTASAGLDQTWAPPEPASLRAQARGLARDPGLAARVLPNAARAAATHAWYDRYPRVADERDLRRWALARDVAAGR